MQVLWVSYKPIFASFDEFEAWSYDLRWDMCTKTIIEVILELSNKNARIRFYRSQQDHGQKYFFALVLI